MHTIQTRAEELKKKLFSALVSAQNLKEIDQIRVDFLGKKGFISQLMTQLKDLPLDEKRTIAPHLQKIKQEAEEHVLIKKKELSDKQLKSAQSKKINFDVTAYKTDRLKGSLHPLSQLIKEIENIFISMGYQLLEGPEIETDFYNFEALNIPQDHPARDMYDTLWLNKPGTLLRTHTSSAQIRALQEKPLPLAGISIGRVFRHEAVDASHDIMFMQCEGILVDKKISLSHLFGVAQHFLQTLFNSSKLDIRVRPGFFPFVEPGVEIDMRCPFCKKGCSVCKKSTWIEVFPGGMIHPNVLRSANINPDEYSGFAFGFGLTRLAMLKYGINDIRLFHCGKNKFLHQF